MLFGQQALTFWLENNIPDHMALEVLGDLIAKGNFCR